MDQNTHRQELLDLYAERPNYGKLAKKTHTATLKNPSCEDIIDIELEVENGKIVNAGFTGGNCLISVVSSCVLLEKVKVMKVEDVLNLEKKDLDKFLGINIIPTRAKCELLALEALKEALNGNRPSVVDLKEALRK